MTIPIARVVATRYPTRRPRCASPTSPHAYRAVKPAPRPAARDPAGGDRARRRARAGGHRRGGLACCARRSTPPGSTPTGSASATLRCSRGRCERAGRARHAAADPATSSPRATWSGWSASWRAVGAVELLDLARDPRRRRGARRSCPRASTLRALYALLRRRRRRARDLRPRPGAHARLLHRARSSRSTTPRSARRWAAAGATTTCSGASAASCPPAAGRWTSSACTPRALEEGRHEDRRAPRGDVQGDARRARRRSGSTPPRCAPTTASCSSRRPG